MRRIAIITTISALAVLPLGTTSAQAAPGPQGPHDVAVGQAHAPQTGATWHRTAPQSLCDFITIPGCDLFHF